MISQTFHASEPVGPDSSESHESGQAITEYILMVLAAVLLATTLTRGLMGAVNRGVLGFGSQLEKDLKTGRTSYSAWQN